MPRWVYKILRPSEWAEFERDGHFAGSPIDRQDGFIHLSYAQQVQETARRHFAGEKSLWLLAIRSDALGPALRDEPSRGGELFPHLYASLTRSQVAQTMPCTAGTDGFPLVPFLEDEV